MVDAIAGRIFPTTDTPGAHEAGVVYFIDKALAGYLSKPTSANPEDQNPVYRRSLDAVDRYAQFKFGRGFLELDGAEQDQVLMDLQDGVEETKRFFKRPTAPAFFNLIRTHVIQGLFSDPMYGGNRDMIGWKLIGFGGAQFGYTEEEMRVRHKREPLSLADHFQYEHGGTG
jgi:gluconate 2-dehydrogenase gamma chain